VIGLVEQYLQQQVMDSGKSWTPEAGTPQGAVLTPRTQSQTLNLYGPWLTRRVGITLDLLS